MTAEPAGRVMWSPDPVRQRLADHTIEDVLNRPDDAPRVEIRDGHLLTAPAPTLAHRQCSHYFTPDQVPLVVEVVSRGTERRDRLARPAQYAEAVLRLTAPFAIELPISDITP